MTDAEVLQQIQYLAGDVELAGDAVMLVTVAQEATDAVGAVVDFAWNLSTEEAQLTAAVLALTVAALTRRLRGEE